MITYDKVENCPQCESWDTEEEETVPDYLQKGKIVILRKEFTCNNCGCKFEVTFSHTSTVIIETGKY
jgi:hypothetical protein